MESLFSIASKGVSKLFDLSNELSNFLDNLDNLGEKSYEGHEFLDLLSENGDTSDDDMLNWCDKFLYQPDETVTALRNDGVNIVYIDTNNNGWQLPYWIRKFSIYEQMLNDTINNADAFSEEELENEVKRISEHQLECLDNMVESRFPEADANYWRAGILRISSNDIQQAYQARRYDISALASTDADQRNSAYEGLNIMQWITTMPFKEDQDYASRQFVYMVRDYKDAAGFYDHNDLIRWIFTLKQYPQEMRFPKGHPQANTLYMAHPADDLLYIPCDNSEKVLFDEKIRELMGVLTDLGATEISYRFLQGADSSADIEQDWSANAEVHVPKVGVSTNVNNSRSSNANMSTKKGEWQTRTLKPTKKPFVNENRKWLQICPEWQSFIHDRLSAGLLESTWRYTSSEVIGLTNDKRTEINASVDYLMTSVKGGGHLHTKEVFNTSNEYEIEITARFKPLEEFEGDTPAIQQSNKLTTQEQSFKEEVIFCLEEDGTLSDTDRKYLERKRVKLGLTEERANEIIEQLLPRLTSEEQEYLETYKEMVGKGNEITPRIRRMLDREANALGIDEKRKIELENSIN